MCSSRWAPSYGCSRAGFDTLKGFGAGEGGAPWAVQRLQGLNRLEPCFGLMHVKFGLNMSHLPFL